MGGRWVRARARVCGDDVSGMGDEVEAGRTRVGTSPLAMVPARTLQRAHRFQLGMRMTLKACEVQRDGAGDERICRAGSARATTRGWPKRLGRGDRRQVGRAAAAASRVLHRNGWRTRLVT